MFGKMMNNYYYGKSGKGDYRKEDLPQTRMQLFWDTLRTRASGLCRLNLLYMLIFLPAMIVMVSSFSNVYSGLTSYMMVKEGTYASYVEQLTEAGAEVPITEEQFNELAAADVNLADYLDSSVFRMLLWLIPCLAITGPFTAGLSYVTRNWARDEHAFIWSDFRDAVKENWKHGLVLSAITSVLPLAVYVGYRFYGRMATNNVIMVIPQVLVVLIAIIWALCITYMHPLSVTYDLKMKGILRNGFLLGIARLPFSVGIRLLHCVPLLLTVIAVWFFGLNPMIALLILCGYYVLIGFSLSRFITASYTNAVFDRFINPKIEGAKVNQGLRKDDDDDDEEDEEEETSEETKEAES